MNSNWPTVRRLIILGLMAGYGIYWLYSFASDHPVFGPPRAKVGASMDWENYYRRRQERNLKAMNLSYDQLMKMAKEQEDLGAYGEAIDHYYTAKTIFPERMEPRVQMCYLYILGCQEDWRICRYAKREIYYALRQVNEADEVNSEYLNELVALLNIEDVVEMDEREAMREIF